MYAYLNALKSALIHSLFSFFFFITEVNYLSIKVLGKWKINPLLNI